MKYGLFFLFISLQVTLAKTPDRAPKCSNCGVPVADTCDFDSYCEVLAKNAKEPFLFESQDGKKLINYELLKGQLEPWMMDDPDLVFLNRDAFRSAEAAGSEEKLKRNQEWLKKASDRLMSTFEKVQSQVIKYLESRKSSGNTTEIDNFISRVKTVKIRAPYPEYTKSFSLALDNCDKPNAAYAPYSHDITFCPHLLTAPEGTLIMLMAHELAHTFDPCAATHILTQNEDKSIRLVGTSETVLERAKYKVEKPDIKSEKYPFNTVLACLKTPQSAGVKQITVDSIYVATEHSYSNTSPTTGLTIEALLEKHKTTYENRKSMLKKYISQYQYCTDFSGYSYMAESFADWIAAEIVAENIKKLEAESKNTLKTSEIAFETLGFLWQRCPQVAYKAVDSKDSRETFFENFNKQFADRNHLSAQIRTNKIYMAQPVIQKNLKCKVAQAPKFCQ